MMGLHESMIHDFKNQQLQYGTNRLKGMIAGTAEKIFPVIKQYDLDQDSFLLLLTGSDGRKENRPDASGVEMIAYTKISLPKRIIVDIATEIGELFVGYNRLSINKKAYGTNKVEVEPKYFTNISNFEDPYSEYTIFFPSRFLDGEVLFGSENVYRDIFNTFQTNVIESKAHDIATFRSRIKYAEDITLHGNREFKGQRISHFNLQKGEIYYNKTSQIETGVKMGPLRLVQYKLSLLITQLLRTQKIDHTDLILFDPFIAKKIDFLRNYVKGGLDESQIVTLETIYYTFLKIHHICQKEYKKANHGFIYTINRDYGKLLKEMTIELSALIRELKVL